MICKSKYLFFYLLFAVTLLGAPNAHAVALNLESDVVFVPYATFDSATATSVVGLVASESGTVYWKFFDQDGGQLQNGSMSVSANHLIAFNWSSIANASLAGTKGYLLFAIDTNGDGLVDGSDAYALAANAFFVDMASSDVVFIPTVFVNHSGLDGTDPATFNIATLPIAAYGFGAPATGAMDMRYYVDGAPGGEDSTIVLWTSADPSPSQSVTMHDGMGNFKTMTLDLPRKRLNLIDPETLTDRPVSYMDGYIRWNPIPSGQTAYAFTLVDTTAFGAIQTLVGGLVIAP